MGSVSIEPGSLYVVATPIGNLSDLSPRAAETLAGVDVIAAEDTRHSAKLLQHIGADTPLVAFHEHNEREMCARLLARLQSGESIALISDAGTPLISDPGFHLVREARARGVPVVPVAGPSAAVCALSVAGLPTDRFVFEGFLPAAAAARRRRLQALTQEPRTMVFYESPHRIVETLHDMSEVLGGDREAAVARELTKVFETVRRDRLEHLLAWVKKDPRQRKGEFVVIVHGCPEERGRVQEPEIERVLRVLLSQLPVKQAASLAAELTGRKKNELYRAALKLQNED